MPSTLDLLTALIDGSTSRSEEREVLDILRSAPAAELDEAMEKLDTVELFDSVDNRLIGRDHRDDLVQLLAYERRDDLGLHAQASIIQRSASSGTSPLSRLMRMTSTASNASTEVIAPPPDRAGRARCGSAHP